MAKKYQTSDFKQITKRYIIMKESDIIAQRGSFWVLDNKDNTYSIMIDGICAAVSFETYNDKSLALARMDYLGRTVQNTAKMYDKVSLGAF